MNIDRSEFCFLLRKLFTDEKKYPLKSIARLMGVNEATLYSYHQGLTYFPPDLIPNLYNATVLYDQQNKRAPAGEMRILTFLLEGTGLEAVPVDRAEDEDSIQKDMLDTYELMGKIIEHIRQAEADSNITSGEADDVSSLIAKAQAELEGIRAKFRKRCE
ncbi:MAG: hypothetical protein HZA22_04520 [Nitrospirae bacterium]|nr:hypothetical protein [Nitrospirota bacterium]